MGPQLHPSTLHSAAPSTHVGVGTSLGARHLLCALRVRAVRLSGSRYFKYQTQPSRFRSTPEDVAADLAGLTHRVHALRHIWDMNPCPRGTTTPKARNPGTFGSGRRGSNPRPLAWEANALPTELHPRRFGQSSGLGRSGAGYVDGAIPGRCARGGAHA